MERAKSCGITPESLTCLNKTAQVKALGNTIPVPMIGRVMAQIGKLLRKNEDRYYLLYDVLKQKFPGHMCISILAHLTHVTDGLPHPELRAQPTASRGYWILEPYVASPMTPDPHTQPLTPTAPKRLRRSPTIVVDPPPTPTARSSMIPHDLTLPKSDIRSFVVRRPFNGVQ